MTGHEALTPEGVATARGLAAALPDLLVEARRVAGSVAAGWHGRRRAGPGEDFWQFRPFLSGESMRGIDWRRSARDETLFVRERERENAHTVWLWIDLTPSMDFRSDLALASKRDLALTLALALAELLSRAGERVGLVGDAEPTARRDGAEVIAMKLARLGPVGASRTPVAMRRRDDVMLISDFLGPQAERKTLFADLATLESRVHLVEIADPAEESFPFAGRVDFVDPENGARLTAGRAEAWRNDYLASRSEHRARLISACRPGWSHTLARADRPATETLITLCGQLSAPEGGGA
ncbi:MAG: hypothetical protein H6Q99_1752 [Proteobacteria bacterium]|nr:hypothetical protein [Pseudomonadota bacterium]